MYQALGSLAYCLPHIAFNSPPPSQATRSLWLLVGAFPAACQCSSCLSIPLLTDFRLLACPFFGCLLNVFLPGFSGCLSGHPAACRTPEDACLPSPAACLPSPAACLPSPAACLPSPAACLPSPAACLPSPAACLPSPAACRV